MTDHLASVRSLGSSSLYSPLSVVRRSLLRGARRAPICSCSFASPLLLGGGDSGRRSHVPFHVTSGLLHAMRASDCPCRPGPSSAPIVHEDAAHPSATTRTVSTLRNDSATCCHTQVPLCVVDCRGVVMHASLATHAVIRCQRRISCQPRRASVPWDTHHQLTGCTSELAISCAGR